MKNVYIRLLVAACALLLLIGILWYWDFYQLFSLSALKSDDHFLRRMLRHNYYGTVITYIAIFVIMIGLSIPGSAGLTLLGGYLFGVFYSVLYSLAGSVIGSLTAFLIFRYGIARAMYERYATRIEIFKKQMKQYGVSYLLLLHFFVVVPYLVINALAALSGVSIWTFIWTTALGGLPIVCVYSFAGRQLSYINSISDIFSPAVILAFFMLIGLSVMPIMIKKHKKVEL